MTNCKPSQPFQAGEGGERVAKEGGRTMKENYCLCIYVKKKKINIHAMSDFNLINSYLQNIKNNVLRKLIISYRQYPESYNQTFD